MNSTLRAVRGAITVEADRADLIREATGALVTALLSANALTRDEVISAYFTATPDLRSEFPATGARAHGWHEVPMLCAQEIDVEGAMPRCIRVLLHVAVPTGKPLRAVYLREAQGLRPDLQAGTPVGSAS